jgi:segregation and condensation protein B
VQVSAIRGVDADGVLRTLVQRGYVAEVARDPGPGQAVLYGTTPTFLERLGLDSLTGLPPLGEFVPGAEVVEALEQGRRLPDEDDPGAAPDLDLTPGADPPEDGEGEPEPDA